jgi:hypothetical protein
MSEQRLPGVAAVRCDIPDLSWATRFPGWKLPACMGAIKAPARQPSRALMRGRRAVIRAYNRAVNDLSHTIDCAPCW